jgi:hypothetical protein
MFKFATNSGFIQKVLGLIYFYFNTVALPVPVTFTTIISFFGFKKAIKQYGKPFIVIISIICLYAIIHNVNGVVVMDYFKSTIYFAALILSGFIAYQYLVSNNHIIEKTFNLLSVSALIFLAVGIVALFTPFADVLWSNHNFIADGEKILRFKGLSYEPSHLALTLSPLFLFFLWKSINKINLKNLFHFTAVAIPIGLSISFGFGAALILSLCLTIIMALTIYQKFKRILLLPIVLALISIIGISYTSSPISERFAFIIHGNDTSVNGRTTEAFMHGYNCAETKSIWFGIGMGQIKYVGEEVIRPYYAAMDPIGYSKEHWPVMSIPNSMAETLAIFGILGVLLKIGFQIFCFVKLKVYDNYLNLSIFFFIFFYQMMGSFILSSTEIMMWAIAFAKIFPEFDVKAKLTQSTVIAKSNFQL